MLNSESDGIVVSGQKTPGLIYRFLKIFTDIKPGEAGTALLLTLNVFLLLLAYYLIKPVREALVISSHGPFVRSSLAAAQAILFIFVVKGFSRLASKVPRHLLITWVTLFFISNLVVFDLLKSWGVPVGTRAIAFFIWVGIFNIMTVAQFWSFAADTFFYRTGDTLAAIIFIIGMQYLHLKLERLAQLNVVVTLIWILLCVLVMREYRKIKMKRATVRA